MSMLHHRNIERTIQSHFEHEMTISFEEFTNVYLSLDSVSPSVKLIKVLHLNQLIEELPTFKGEILDSNAELYQDVHSDKEQSRLCIIYYSVNLSKEFLERSEYDNHEEESIFEHEYEYESQSKGSPNNKSPLPESKRKRICDFSCQIM